MTKTFKILDWTGVVFINLALLLLTVGLQFLLYATAPAAFSSDTIFKNFGEKKIACEQATMDINKTLYFELFIGSLLVFVFTRIYFKDKNNNPNRNAFIFLITYLILCILTMNYFTQRYISLYAGL